MPRSPRRNHGCRIDDAWTLHGIPALVMENERLRVTVLTGQGADIVEFLYKPEDLDCLWASPQGITPAGSKPPGAPWDGQFADHYEGGWQEIFPHGSKPGTLDGVEMPQHGEVWALPWEVEVLEDSPACVSARFRVRTRRTPFLLERTMTLRAGGAALEIGGRVTHEGSSESNALFVMWGHHPAFGAPLLGPDARIFTSARSVRHNNGTPEPWPGKADFSRLPPEDAGIEDMVYLLDYPGETGWYALVDTRRKIGFGLCFDAGRFPVTWIWRNIRAAGAPWYGRCHVVAMEPFTSFPAAAENEKERMRIEPGQTIETRLLAVAIDGLSEVREITADGSVLGA